MLHKLISVWELGLYIFGRDINIYIYIYLVVLKMQGKTIVLLVLKNKLLGCFKKRFGLILLVRTHAS